MAPWAAWQFFMSLVLRLRTAQFSNGISVTPLWRLRERRKVRRPRPPTVCDGISLRKTRVVLVDGFRGDDRPKEGKTINKNLNYVKDMTQREFKGLRGQTKSSSNHEAVT